MDNLQSTANTVEVKLLAPHEHAGVKYAPGAVLNVAEHIAATLVKWKVAELVAKATPDETPSDTPAPTTPASEREHGEDGDTKAGVLAASAPPRRRFSRTN